MLPQQQPAEHLLTLPGWCAGALPFGIVEQQEDSEDARIYLNEHGAQIEEN